MIVNSETSCAESFPGFRYVASDITGPKAKPQAVSKLAQ